MRVRVFVQAALLLPFLVPAQPAGAAESVYTDIDIQKCKTLAEPAPGEEGDFIVSLCGGYKDYGVLFKEGDMRQTTFFGFLDQKIIDDAFTSFGPFNHIGSKVEWRIGSDGKPLAAILRYHIENANEVTGVPDTAHEGQVLVISRVGQPDDRVGCVIGYVDALANKDANVLARKIADAMAPGFACGTDSPEFHGIKGDKAGETTNYFPDIAN
jgi:hypothetical protein